MLTFRTFRNSDPPVLSALWRTQDGQPGLWQPASPDLLEQFIFSRLYFDYGGLLLAFEDDRPVGFAHAGFGPNSEKDRISPDIGVTCVVLVRPDCDRQTVAAALLERSEAYLRQRGAAVLYGGGASPFNPFYLGLYGGSDSPGILDSDTTARVAFAAAGYREVDYAMLLRRPLDGYELPVDRRFMQVRRQTNVQTVPDAPTKSWWEACTLGNFDLTRFDLVPRGGGRPVATATFRNMEPIGAATMSRAVGLIGLTVEESMRRRGLATLLLSESFCRLFRQGTVQVDVQTSVSNIAALGVYQKLGFKQSGTGTVWRKDV